MAIWQQNLMSNLLVAFILIALLILIYCRISGKTFADLVKELREIMNPPEYE